MKFPSGAVLAILLFASTIPAHGAQLVAVDLGRNNQTVEAGITRNYGDIPTTPLGDLRQDSFLVDLSAAGGYFELILDQLGDALSSLGLVASTTGTDISGFASLSVGFTVTAAKDG